VTFTLDGREVTANAGEFVIAAAERAGVFIPRFCYHPRMKPVGMCRMCLVEVSGPRGATLQPACYVSVGEGMEVVTDSEKVRKAQDAVLEFLLVNHPLDCPVCDKGGECPLQDQTFAYGPGESRFLEEKRHWSKPIPLSELVLLDRERCIQCGRCVRFALEVAGEPQIDFLGRGDQVEVNVFEEQPFTSYFSGNTIQICPVGALTAVPYRFGARPWDLEQVESTCTLCALGCRAVVQSSANRLTRLIGVDSDSVNQSWLCDKGRFGYEAVNSEDRLVQPLLRRSSPDSYGELEPASWAEVLSEVADRLTQARAEFGAASIGIVGGARLANEDAYAWAKLAKSVIGTDCVDAQLADGLPAEVVLGLPRATIDEVCAARRVVLLSGDLREELPVLFLRLREAVVSGGLEVVELTPRPTSFTPYAAASISYRPGEAASVTGALVSGTAPPHSAGGPAWDRALGALAGAAEEGVAIVVGRPSLAERGELVAMAAVTMAQAWPSARFLPALRRGNVMGALDMGLAPGVLPGRVSMEEGREWFTRAWGSLPAEPGLDAAGIFEASASGDMKVLVLLGADPIGDFPDAELAAEALLRADFVVALDSFLSPSAVFADAVLPVATVHERAGTTTNIEGRITRLGQKLLAPGQCRPDWMIAAELATRMGRDLGVTSVAELWDEIEGLAPSHAGITRAVLDLPAARDGIVAPLAVSRVSLEPGTRLEMFDPMATPGITAVEAQGAPLRAGVVGDGRAVDGPEGSAAPARPAGGSRPTMMGLPRSLPEVRVPPADSYSLRLIAQRSLYDGGVTIGACASLAALVPAAVLHVNSHDLERIGVATGDRVRVRSSRTSAVLEVAADEGVTRGTAALGFNLRSADAAGVAALIEVSRPVVDVRLETL
jgi:NADH-quinone oxidoreductase subunit G